jgi:hypothetical protein
MAAATLNNADYIIFPFERRPARYFENVMEASAAR